MASVLCAVFIHCACLYPLRAAPHPNLPPHAEEGADKQTLVGLEHITRNATHPNLPPHAEEGADKQTLMGWERITLNTTHPNLPPHAEEGADKQTLVGSEYITLNATFLRTRRKEHVSKRLWDRSTLR